MHLMGAALKECPSVERDLGYPPPLTPTSQIVGAQAVFNALAGERYQIISREVTDYIAGKYGRPPGRVSTELLAKVVAGKEPGYSIRAGQLADPGDWEKAAARRGGSQVAGGVYRYVGPGGVLSRTWPPGTAVLWVVFLLGVFLLLYYGRYVS